MIHELKTWNEFMLDLATGKKPFEVRVNDRHYKEGDTLMLKGWNKEQGYYTGLQVTAFVTYILYGPAFGIKEGYCVMGLMVTNQNLNI